MHVYEAYWTSPVNVCYICMCVCVLISLLYPNIVASVASVYMVQVETKYINKTNFINHHN